MTAERYSLVRDLIYAASVTLAGTALAFGLIFCEQIGQWARWCMWRIFG